MRKVMMMAMALAMGECLCGCSSAASFGPMKWTVVSIPEGMFGWELQTPGVTLKSSLDVGKTVGFAIDGVNALIAGMVPLG